MHILIQTKRHILVGPLLLSIISLRYKIGAATDN